MRYFRVEYSWTEHVKVDVPDGEEHYCAAKDKAEEESFRILMDTDMEMKELVRGCLTEVEEIDAEDYMGETGDDEEDEDSSSSPVEADGSVGPYFEKEEEQEEAPSLVKPWEGEFPE